MTSHKKAARRALVRYLVVGIGNTVFGYACYVAFVFLYKHILPPHYIYRTVVLAQISATPLGVTYSFLMMKRFVFRTRGRYLQEWFRCLLVYSAGSLPGLFVLPVVTRLLLMVPHLQAFAAYLAGGVVMGGTAVITYFAHKHFSFGTARTAQLEPVA